MTSRGFQNPHGMKQTSLSDIWEDLHSGIRHAFSRQNMPKARYMELHTYPLPDLHLCITYITCSMENYCVVCVQRYSTLK